MNVNAKRNILSMKSTHLHMLLTKTLQLLKLLLHLLLMLCHQMLLLYLILLACQTLYVCLNFAQAGIHSATNIFLCVLYNLDFNTNA